MLTEPTRRDPYRIPPEAIADAEPIIRELATDFALEAAASGDHALVLRALDILVERLAHVDLDREDAIIRARRGYFQGLNLWEPRS